MKCPECGTQNLEGAGRCFECGASLEKKKASTPGSGWPLYAFIGVGITVILALLLVSGGSGGGGGASPSGASSPATASVSATGSAPATGAAQPATSTPKP